MSRRNVYLLLEIAAILSIIICYQNDNYGFMDQVVVVILLGINAMSILLFTIAAVMEKPSNLTTKKTLLNIAFITAVILNIIILVVNLNALIVDHHHWDFG